MYALVLSLYQLGNKDGDFNKLLILTIAKQIHQLQTDIGNLPVPLDQATQAILNGLTNTQDGYFKGESLGDLCAKIANGTATGDDIDNLMNNMDVLKDLGQAITGTPSSNSDNPFQMPFNSNWFTFEKTMSGGVSPPYSKGANSADFITSLNALLKDLSSGNYANIAQDIIALDGTATGGNDSYMLVVKEILETAVPGAGASLLYRT